MRTSAWAAIPRFGGSSQRIRELERLLGRKTMEVEILKDALAKSQAKKSLLSAPPLKDGSRPANGTRRA